MTLIERFEKKFIRRGADECWEWQNCLNSDGYGQIRIKNKIIGAHRVSWSLYSQESIGDLHVLHKCDNRKCVNPNHLFLGTKKDNSVDMEKKGRGKIRLFRPCNKGENSGLSKLSTEQVLKIRSEYIPRINSTYKLSKQYGVKPQTIWAIVKNLNWRHIT